MEESGFFPSVGSSLSSMMDLDESDGSPWAEEEFGAILRISLLRPWSMICGPSILKWANG